jgi:hypothetical protein
VAKWGDGWLERRWAAKREMGGLGEDGWLRREMGG